MSANGWRRHLPDGHTRLLGIIGNPIDHSLSPGLHTAVLRALDRNLIYLPFPVSEERLPGFLAAAPELGLVGLNVTTPFKEAAARLVAPADEEARRTGMVNTIRFRDGAAVGCGTDGAGILEWCDESGLGRRPIGLLGFGPTSRSLAWRARGRLACIVSRRPDEVRRLLGEWGDAETTVRGWDDLDERPAAGAIWVSALPAAAAPPSERLWDWMGRQAVVLDMNYGAGRAAVCELARARGIRAADGLGPLCHQAALSLSFWLGEPVAASLFRRALGSSSRALRPRR